jgi:hypothetical protein
VSAVTREKERLVDEMLTHERVEVERIPIGLPVDAVPPVREEGDTTISRSLKRSLSSSAG